MGHVGTCGVLLVKLDSRKGSRPLLLRGIDDLNKWRNDCDLLISWSFLIIALLRIP